MATSTTKATQSSALPMQPWEYLALIARCAQEVGIEVDRAFKFMGAINVAMQQAAKTHAAPPAATTVPSSTTPQ